MIFFNKKNWPIVEMYYLICIHFEFLLLRILNFKLYISLSNLSNLASYSSLCFRANALLDEGNLLYSD
jgi:hypothetical protein